MQTAKQMKHNIPKLLRFAQKGNKKVCRTHALRSGTLGVG